MKEVRSRGMKLLFCVLFLFAQNALAHPVAYEGSTGIMGYHSKDMSDMELNYSVRYWFAPSIQALRFQEGRARPNVVLGKLNFLAKRWNGENFQANIYLHAGAGNSDLSGRNRTVFHGGFTADIEDRKHYFLTEAGTLRTASGAEVTMWKLRAGFAPYVADFDKLHSWFIVEANRNTYGAGQVEIVPTLRFFYENVLWEIGASLKGTLHLNYIIHI